MSEIELKFQVGAKQRAAVMRAVATRSAHRVRLAAQYFDTADRRLAEARLALRVRKEGRSWVQTLKGAGDGLWQRLEHEAPVQAAAGGGMPSVDVGLHDGTAAGAALGVARNGAELQPIYATQVTRTLRLIRARDCVVEVAFDVGSLIAAGRRLPLCELEFELKQGDAGAMCALAERWVTRFGLTLDVRSKSERGDRLACGMPQAQPVRAGQLELPRRVDSGTAMRAIVADGLRQVLGNASELLHGDGSAEHLHQLRIGLRRLRTALRELGGAWPQHSADWLERAEPVFASLGGLRDRDALGEWLLPALHRAGAAGLALPAASLQDESLPLLRAAATTRLWLAMLAFAARDEATDDRFAKRATQRLQHLHRQVRRDARRFAKLDDTARHRLRKRVKRLRYLCEFAGSQFRRRRVDAYLGRLKPAQDALGHYQDVVVAQAMFETAADDGTHAGFALGWLAREREVAAASCSNSLEAFRKAPTFW